MRWTLLLLVLVSSAGLVSAETPGAGNWDLGGEGAVTFRYFPYDPLFPEQKSSTVSPSVLLAPELLYQWNAGLDRFTFTPFARLDSHDNRRSHVDIRELNWVHQSDDWSLLLGVGKVFWGVTESRHLVDIINQDDWVEDIDGEDKLGQPMVNLTLERGWGALDFFFLPYFRKRTFPGSNARLRGPYPILLTASYESNNEEWHPDWALRWSHTLGEFDVGVAHFRGTSREPRFLPLTTADGLKLAPRYDIIDQTSLDLQWTRDAWLWKLETIGRRGHGDYFGAVTGGFEYTFYQTFQSAADLGLVVEYLYDGRSDDPTLAPFTSYDNDLFTGARLALNNIADTQILGGTILDTANAETFMVIEASHRLGNRWLVDVEARWFLNTDQNGFTAAFRDDSFLSLGLKWFF
jgi:hypothetical protein